jgi:hypothetical protein
MKRICLGLMVMIIMLVTGFTWQNGLVTIGEGDQPSLSIGANGIIGITYGSGKDIYFSESSDNGKTFKSPEKVATFNQLVLGMSSGPSLSMGKSFYSVVAPDSDGNLSAWRKKIGGNKWEGPFRVNDIPRSAGESLADVSSDENGILYATWIDTRREMEDHAAMGHDMPMPKEAIKEKEAEEGHNKIEKKREVKEQNHDMGSPQMYTKEEIMKRVGDVPKGGEVKTYMGDDGKLYWVVTDKEGKVLKAEDLEGYKAFKAQNAGRMKAEGKIFISSSKDGGMSWSKSQLVYASPDGSVCECCKPSIIASGGNVHIMFRNNVSGNRDLYLTQSKDGGNSFGTPQKLGAGSWQLNGCPMDGGGLDITNGKVVTAWQRKGVTYLSVPGAPEKMIGSGRSPSIASNKEGNYILWSDGPSVMAITPNSSSPINIGVGSSPKTIKIANGQGVLGVWINEGKVVAKRL